MAITEIKKGYLNGISSKGGYWQNGVFYPNPVDPSSPEYILWGQSNGNAGTSNTGGVTFNTYSTSYAGTSNVASVGSSSSFTLEDDGYGVKTSSVTVVQNSPSGAALGSGHPRFGFLKCYKSSVQQSGSHSYTVTNYYIGLESSVSSPVISGDFGLSSIPIRLHPKFATLSKSNNWDEDKQVFTSGDIAGHRTYLAATCTYSGYYYSTSNTSSSILNRLGKASGSLPFKVEDAPSGSGLCWFINGASVEKVGHLYRIKFSAIFDANGWNKDLYT